HTSSSGSSAARLSLLRAIRVTSCHPHCHTHRTWHTAARRQTSRRAREPSAFSTAAPYCVRQDPGPTAHDVPSLQQ
ncbi:hypothetical protein M9458_022707, partial [Cirrhinus mrigala]